MTITDGIRHRLRAGQDPATIALELGVTINRVHVVRWQMRHPEKKAEYARAYWHRNKERLQAIEKERKRAHKTRLDEQRKALCARIRELERELRNVKRAQRPPKLIQGPANWYG